MRALCTVWLYVCLVLCNAVCAPCALCGCVFALYQPCALCACVLVCVRAPLALCVCVCACVPCCECLVYARATLMTVQPCVMVYDVVFMIAVVIDMTILFTFHNML